MNYELITYYLLDIMLPAVWVTIVILFFTVIISCSFGTLLGVGLYVTAPSGLCPNRFINNTVGVLINTIRSIPTIIQIVLLIPVSRMVVGTSLGIKAGVFTVSVGSIMFVSRVVEGKLKEVDPELIDAAQSMGLSTFDIVTRIVLHEAVPSLISGYAFSSILILGAIAAAGTVGAGGIGIVALNYGYSSFNPYVMYGCIFILVIMVVLIQIAGRKLHDKLK